MSSGYHSNSCVLQTTFYEPPSISTVIQGILYLGNIYVLNKDSIFVYNDIGGIVNCTTQPTPSSIIKKFGKSNCIHFPLYDDTKEYIFDYFMKFWNFMKKCEQNKITVFVHCRAGISRSSTIVVSYLMKKNKWKRDKSIKFLRKCRSIINPNKSFKKQLFMWEYVLGLNKKLTIKSIKNKQKMMKELAKSLHEED